MADKKVLTIGVLTSGGDAPGMNAAIRAVVRRALGQGLCVKGIYRGYQGLIDEEIKELVASDVSNIIGRGGTVLYTARCKAMYNEDGQKKAAENCRKHGIDVIIVIGGDGSFKGALDLSRLGIPVIGVPATIDLDIGCTDYSIGFDTAINTAMEAIDKVRDTAISHERCSIIEVMGRKAGYIGIWSGMASGVEDILIPEMYDGDESKVIQKLVENRKKGKTHHIIVNAEGIGDSMAMAERIEAATGIETRATIIGYLQRGGSPTCRDRTIASVMGAFAVDLAICGKTNRVVALEDGDLASFEIEKALEMEGDIPDYYFEIAQALSYNYSKKLKTL